MDVIYLISFTRDFILKTAPLKYSNQFIIKFANDEKELLGKLKFKVSNLWKLINVRKKLLPLSLFFKCHLKSRENRNICF